MTTTIKFFSAMALAMCFSFTTQAQWEMATNTVGDKKTVYTTKFQKGYVKDMNGLERVGEIKIKVVNNDTVEVTFQDDAGKTKFPRLDLQSFGLRLKPADLKNDFKDTRKNFNPGYIINAEGKRMEGQLAIRYQDEETKSEGKLTVQKWTVYSLLFAQNDGYVILYMPAQVKEFGMTDGTEKRVYDQYQSVWTERLVDGPIKVWKNPFPTTKNKLANFAAGAASNAATNKAAEVAIDNDVKMTSAGGGSSSGDGMFKLEYIILKKGSTEPEIINEKALDEWVARTLASCEAYQNLSDKAKKKEYGYNNLDKVVKLYNEKCAN